MDLSALIVTHENDLHALLVQERMESACGVRCHVLEFDRLAIDGGLSWSVTGEADSIVNVRGGGAINVADVDVVWWRRFRSGPFKTIGPVSSAGLDLIEKDGRASIEGLLADAFKGSWVSQPDASRRADNKLIQLRAAQTAGLRVPRTLVSQDPAAIRRFCRRFENRVVAKVVRGTHMAPTATVQVTDELLRSDSSMRISPVIYQELIEGTTHLRVHCFGSAFYAVQIDSEDLDWRLNLNVPMRIVTVDEEVRKRLLTVLRILGLKMGIFDLKIDKRGNVCWLEVNPQGQFLFLHALVPIDLVAPLADFLRMEAEAGAQRR